MMLSWFQLSTSQPVEGKTLVQASTDLGRRLRGNGCLLWPLSFQFVGRLPLFRVATLWPGLSSACFIFPLKPLFSPLVG